MTMLAIYLTGFVISFGLLVFLRMKARTARSIMLVADVLRFTIISLVWPISFAGLWIGFLYEAVNDWKKM